MARQPSNVAALSRLMAFLSLCGFVLLPICVVYVFVAPDRSQWMMLDINHLGAEINSAVPIQLRLMALCCALVPTGFTMWALWSLQRLFRLYAKGSVFSAEALAALNAVAIALSAGVVAAFVAQAPISLALTWYHGPHHREISLGFGSGDVATLFTAGVVLVIARVMREAQRVVDENAKFV